MKKKNQAEQVKDEPSVQPEMTEEITTSGTEESPEEQNIEEKKTEDSGQLAELNDKYLRLYSEFDNYRRRTLKERAEMARTASEEILKALLPVVDDFERGLQAMKNLEADSPYRQGMELVYSKLMGTLISRGLESMKTIGNPFDTDYHDAIARIPAPSEDMKGKIMDEVEKGYMLGGKVIRFAKVVVGE